MSEIREVCLIVDGDDLFRAPQKVAGRNPERHERLDYAKLRHFAEWEAFGERRVRAVYFQREHNTAAAFYHALHGFGYELELSPYDEGFEVVKQRILRLLEELKGEDCDLIYAGGDSYFGQITSALRELLHADTGPARNIMVAHFAGWRSIEDPELEYRDIVRDIGAMPESIYEGPGTTASEGTAPSFYRAGPPAGEAEPASQLGEALSGEIEEAIRAGEAGAGDEEEAEEPATDGAAPTAAARGSESVVLIDCENIDWHLSDMLGGKQHLNQETRPRWAELKRFALERAGGATVGIAAYLQFNEQVSGFARYLDAELGFNSVILRPEFVTGEGGRETRRPVVDEAIYKMLDLLTEMRWSGDVCVVSNDGGYLPRLEALHEAGGGGRISVIGFVDEMRTDYSRADWLEKHDLEDDVGAFSYKLPRRFRPVAMDQYDPNATLRAMFGEEPGGE